MNTTLLKQYTTTAAQHIANIKGIAAEYLKTANIDEIFENLNIITACRDIVDILNKYQPTDILTVEYFEGFEDFSIIED